MKFFDSLLASWCVFLIFTCATWILFSRKYLKALQGRVKKAGLYEQKPVDIMGMRVLVVSNILVLPEFVAKRFKGTPLEGTAAMRAHASVADKRSALFLVLAMHSLALLTLAIYILPED